MATEKEIQEGNKLIAEFMGYEIEQKYFITDISIARKNGEQYFASKLKYHSSWDWLMPAAKKSVDYVKVDTAGSRLQQDILRGTRLMDIEECWLAVVKFISWYNKQSNPQPHD